MKRNEELMSTRHSWFLIFSLNVLLPRKMKNLRSGRALEELSCHCTIVCCRLLGLLSSHSKHYHGDRYAHNIRNKYSTMMTRACEELPSGACEVVVVVFVSAVVDVVVVVALSEYVVVVAVIVIVVVIVVASRVVVMVVVVTCFLYTSRNAQLSKSSFVPHSPSASHSSPTPARSQVARLTHSAGHSDECMGATMVPSGQMFALSIFSCR